MVRHKATAYRGGRARAGTISLLAVLTSLLLSSCGDSKKEANKLEGRRYGVRLVRASTEQAWVAVTGVQEWWFFVGGIFRQISTDYVEPQFYRLAPVETGDGAEGAGAEDDAGLYIKSQACNGDATGSYTQENISEGGVSRVRVTLKYSGVTDQSGLCRTTDRVLEATLQPSGAVDLLDKDRVQRLEKIENLN